MQLKTTKDYRLIDVDSYSTLKDFDNDILLYYKKYVLKEKVKEEVSWSMILGELVDCLMFAPEEYHERFVESNVRELEPGKNQMSDFTLKLWEITKFSTDDDGICSRSFMEMAEEAFNLVKYDLNGNEVKFLKKDLNYVLEKFVNSEFEEWYNLKRNSFGKYVISLQDKEKADKIVNMLKELLFKYLDNSRYVFFNHPRVLFNLYGVLPFKSEFDFILLDLQEKEILPFDLKVTHDISNFSYSYLKNKYYIQAHCYTEAVKVWVEDNSVAQMLEDGGNKGLNLKDFSLNGFNFLVADSGCHYKPLVYFLSNIDLYKAKMGFKVNGKIYRGVKQIVEDLLWAKKTGDFTIYKHDLDSMSKNGFLKLDITYED